jgi:syntaxin 1B/2/3
MDSLAQTQAVSEPDSGVYSILNKCGEVDVRLDLVDENLQRLQALYRLYLDTLERSQQSMVNADINILTSDVLASCSALASEIGTIKRDSSSRMSRNKLQVIKVEERLNKAFRRYKEIENDFQQKHRAQLTRQYRIVEPELSDAEIVKKIESSSNYQVFGQMILLSNRQGQSSQVFNAVEIRHVAIQQIGKQIQEIAQLSQDVERLVTDKETPIANIESGTEDVGGQVEKAGGEIGQAVVSARSRNRNKWYCLLLGTCSILRKDSKLTANNSCNHFYYCRRCHYNSSRQQTAIENSYLKLIHATDVIGFYSIGLQYRIQPKLRSHYLCLAPRIT